MPRRLLAAAWIAVAIVYVHNALPHLTTLPRVNVDEPWLMERAYQVLKTWQPRQPMFGLERAYLLQPGYSYVLAPWIGLFGVGMFQARLLSVLLAGGIAALAGGIATVLISPGAGLVAAVLLVSDSNFLGGARYARTDTPSVFFAALAIFLFVRGRDRGAWWAAASGAATGAAILCHGNAYWVAVTLLFCYLVDRWRRPIAAYGVAYLLGIAATFGPYVAILLTHATEFRTQVANFAGDRVPGLSPAFVWQQILREPERYTGWYFGLVTSLVPDPLLRVFQAAVVVGASAIAIAIARGGDIDRRRLWIAWWLLVVPVAVFAGFINNKVPVYMPHLLLGFAIAAGVGAQLIADAMLRQRAIAAIAAGVTLYGAAAIYYYERWYRSARKSELVAYEATSATLRTLVPGGPKLLVASPHFWVPYATNESVRFVSYTGVIPDATSHLAGATMDRPTYLVVDELQWLPDLEATATQTTPAWRRSWMDYIENRCGLDAVAIGTAYGNLALYRCERPDASLSAPPRLIGGTATLTPDDETRVFGPRELAGWAEYHDPRASNAVRRAIVDRNANGVRLAGGTWPGIERYLEVKEGERYLVTFDVDGAADRDLLYLGRWERPEVQSLSGASAAGIVVPLRTPAWFPTTRGFIATAPGVRMLFYSEAPQTDFRVKRVVVTRAVPAPAVSPPIR